MEKEKELKTFQDYAKFLYHALEVRKRDNGEEFYYVKDEFDGYDNEEYSWINDVIRTGHDNGELLPNDCVYSIINDALSIICECETQEEAEERIYSELEADIYNSNLLKWVASNLTFSYYVDEAMTEYGANTLFDALSYGQKRFKEEIAFNVLNKLVEISE